ncbi:methyltransferase, FxLD system [Embleya sp. NPDC020630]|uniref:methyltransferase, FxLD system n=1 Tax=Embleya sp. NPDC020630 TaxID=3363979 RepID=UPI0037A60E77
MTTTTGPTPDTLRGDMVDRLLRGRPTLDPRVADAMRALPRHMFVPDAPLDEAYAEQAVITKRNDTGIALSCASGPGIVAGMLHQLRVRPGDNIMEIGAGTGYNAALLQRLTEPTGRVVTLDIDPEVTAGARSALDATGNQAVRVITRNGVLGAPEHAPYQRIVVTVGTWDIPTPWWHQLAPEGRLVAPLRWRGQTRAVAFTLTEDNVLVSDSVELCGFVPMVGQEGEVTAPIDADGEVALHWDDDQNIDPTALTGVLDQPRHTVWSDVFVTAGESFDGVWLRLAASEPGTCRIAADPTAVDSGRCTPAIPSRSAALVDDASTSLAYFTLRRQDPAEGPTHWELGAHAHGPQGHSLAQRMCDGIHAWNDNRNAEPRITVHPAGTHDATAPAGGLITKHLSQLSVVY